ncbi:hypothetical protein QJQ45_002468 [Haematococcus lacustris]|nr:hypothetical protein QJQ45_002468 [Haematococcus lacustris]
MSQPELLEMRKQVAAFLEQGIIEPSSSPYAAPVLFVKKKSEQLLTAYAADEDFASSVDQYDQDKHGLYRTKGKNQIVVPNCQQLKARILVEMHDAQFAGHVGITKTLERISRIFWWPRMRSEVRHYSDWPFFLSLAEFAVNNSWQESIQSTPFLVNTGQSPLTPALLELPGEVYCPSARKLSEWWQSNVKQARHFMEQAQQRQAYLANKGRRDVEYHPGQLVLLSTKNLRLKPGKAKKLLPRFIGPFKVLEHVGPVAVRLDLPPAMARMHPVFHVALLRPYTSEHPHLPPPVDWLDEAPLEAAFGGAAAAMMAASLPWRPQGLNLLGRVQVAQQCLASKSIYQMALERSPSSSRLYPSKAICVVPRGEGGVGLPDLGVTSTVMLAKMLAQLWSPRVRPWQPLTHSLLADPSHGLSTWVITYPTAPPSRGISPRLQAHVAALAELKLFRAVPPASQSFFSVLAEPLWYNAQVRMNPAAREAAAEQGWTHVRHVREALHSPQLEGEARWAADLVMACLPEPWQGMVDRLQPPQPEWKCLRVGPGVGFVMRRTPLLQPSHWVGPDGRLYPLDPTGEGPLGAFWAEGGAAWEPAAVARLNKPSYRLTPEERATHLRPLPAQRHAAQEQAQGQEQGGARAEEWLSGPWAHLQLDPQVWGMGTTTLLDFSVKHARAGQPCAKVWKELLDPTLRREHVIVAWRVLHASLMVGALWGHILKGTAAPGSSACRFCQPGHLETLTHAFLTCPAVVPAWEWVLDVYGRLTGTRPPSGDAMLLLSGRPTRGEAPPFQPPDSLLWLRLRVAFLGAVWRLRSSGAATALQPQQVARRVVEEVIATLTTAVKRDWHRVGRDIRVGLCGAVPSTWFKGKDPELALVGISSQAPRPTLAVWAETLHIGSL